jgi:L-arabinose isomerase
MSTKNMFRCRKRRQTSANHVRSGGNRTERKMQNPTLWFVTGSQHLYGPEVLRQVAQNAQVIAQSLAESAEIPVDVQFRPVITDPDNVRQLVMAANQDPDCIGLVLWMHTFSPGKMWIGGLGQLQKPVLHLHTQYNEQLPWDSIDMDFMNLNQAAHGDREAGHIHARLGLRRKVVVGHWGRSAVQQQIGDWARFTPGCAFAGRLWRAIGAIPPSKSRSGIGPG